MTSTMIIPDIVPSPTYTRLLPGDRNGKKMSMTRMCSSISFVQTCTKSAATAMTPVVRCADCSSTRWRMESTSRSVATSPIMIVIDSATRLSTPM